MTEPSQQRPVPGPPRPGPVPPATDQAVSPTENDGTEQDRAESPLADLDERPVAEHVAVFEAEHARLERELGTIDRL
jgi:hypothetical protein